MFAFVSSSLQLFVLLLGGLPAALAVKCGVDFWTDECVGDTDKRYDPDTSINIVDQSDIWARRAGYFEVVEYNYGPDYQVLTSLEVPIPGGGGATVSLDFSPNTVYQNVTYAGSRGYWNSVAVLNNTNPALPGAALAIDNYEVSTFEKDGSVITLPFTAQFVGTGGETDKLGIGYPVGDDTIFKLQHGKTEDGTKDTIFYETNTCLDEGCDSMLLVRQTVTDGVLVSFAAATATRITEDEWVSKINEAYASANVLPALRFPVPQTKSCLLDCVTEEELCDAGDPSCNESPYQEPDGKLTTGAIVVIALGSFVVAVLLVFVVIQVVVKRQERRYRAKFASRIAATIDLQKSMKSLTPTVLANEFNKIDEEKDGRISKDELWNFLNSNGGDGDDQIRQHDFNALWAALDTHGTGQVDFLEFCAFFSECQDEYDEARRKNPTRRASVRQSLAASMTQKYNEVSKPIEPSEPLQPTPEAGEEATP